MIHKGDLMRKDGKLKKWVHFSCARIQQKVIDRVKEETSTSSSDSAHTATTLPHGLAANSLADYSKEWSKYVQFASQLGATIPGRDAEWDLDLVWDYLRFRARTCKPETLKQVLTKLSLFGVRNKFILATSKFDGNSYAYKSLTKMKKQ